MSVRRRNGFTLIELLVVVSLIIIIVGVTGDIIISLVRSYSKTQITNEIGQNVNFVMTKLEKELRNAASVDEITNDSITFTRRYSDGSSDEIIYSIVQGGGGINYIERSVNGAPEILTNTDLVNGVDVDIATSSFTDVSMSAEPKVIRIALSFRQAGNPAVQFRQDVQLETTIVVRGTY